MGDFENFIKAELEIKGLSQREAARKAGISHAYLSAILRGDRDISCNFCFAMAKALNEPVWKILQLSGLIDNVPKNLVESEEVKSLVRKYNELSKENKDHLITTIDVMLMKQRKKP